MSFLASAMAAIALAVGAVLVLVVLLQDPKGAGLAGVLGQSGDEVLGGTASRGIRRLTGWLAAAWLGACLVSALVL
jgi:protein translocase SecG subunit